MSEKLPIIICLGSSCFARGNEANLRLLEDYLSLHSFSERVSLSGRCCAFQCAAGPNISIGGVVYNHVTAAQLLDLLRHHLPAPDIDSDTSAGTKPEYDSGIAPL